MGLSQELVDGIVEALHEDLPALKACSLTCKAMFSLTRHLIHQTLYLTPQNNESVLTPDERERLHYRKQGYQDVQLRFLSYVGEHGLLQYTRKIHIYTESQPIPSIRSFTPYALLPHIRHFRSLDRIHAITIDGYDDKMWGWHSEWCFGHFYPTLTSLTHRRPSGRYQSILQFALQFPNLENLTLEWLPVGAARPPPAPAAVTIIDQSSLIRGHLRLVDIDDAALLPMDFAHELRNGFNFRSVELDSASGNHGQRLLNAYADTIRELTIVSNDRSTY